MLKTIFGIAVIIVLSVTTHVAAQTIKMTIGQTGINPGTAPFIIAQKENFFAKHGLEVKIIETQTTAAVQAMLGGSMQFTMGAGAAFTTATLEGAPPFVNVASWINVFPYYLVARKEFAKVADLKGKLGQVGGPFGAAPDVAMRFGLSKLGIDPEKDVKFVQMGRPDWANVIVQLEKGDVQFSVRRRPSIVSPRRAAFTNSTHCQTWAFNGSKTASGCKNPFSPATAIRWCASSARWLTR